MKIFDIINEGHYRRPGSPTAYDRDYRSSVSGMGKHDSIAYQQDGGANDEGWDKEEWKPREEPIKLTAIYFYNVPAGMEDEARAAGLSLTKNGKWGLKQYNKSGRTFAHQSNVASAKFGKPRIWHPTNESATAGATSAANVGTVVNPHHSPGKARGKKSYLGSPGSGSGTKAPPQPKVVQPKSKDGTAVNGLDIKGSSLFGGPANEGATIKRR
jgi:hypothetical protein